MFRVSNQSTTATDKSEWAKQQNILVQWENKWNINNLQVNWGPMFMNDTTKTIIINFY